MEWKFGSRKTINVALLTMMAFGALSSASQKKEVVARVDGMTCYSCAYSIQKICKIQKIGAGYEKDIEKGLFKINLGPKERVPEPADVKKIVDDAGYTYRGANTSVSASVTENQGKKLGLRLPETGQVIWVETAPGLNPVSADKGQTVHVQLEAGEKDALWKIASIKIVSEERDVQ